MDRAARILSLPGNPKDLRKVFRIWGEVWFAASELVPCTNGDKSEVAFWVVSDCLDTLPKSTVYECASVGELALV